MPETDKRPDKELLDTLLLQNVYKWFQNWSETPGCGLSPQGTLEIGTHFLKTRTLENVCSKVESGRGGTQA
jgi:hypothetical protein